MLACPRYAADKPHCCRIPVPRVRPESLKPGKALKEVISRYRQIGHLRPRSPPSPTARNILALWRREGRATKFLLADRSSQRCYKIRADMPNPPQPAAPSPASASRRPRSALPVELISRVSESPSSDPDEILDIYASGPHAARPSRAGAGDRHALADLLQSRASAPGYPSRTPGRKPTQRHEGRTRLSTETAPAVGIGARLRRALRLECRLHGQSRRPEALQPSLLQPGAPRSSQPLRDTQSGRAVMEAPDSPAASRSQFGAVEDAAARDTATRSAPSSTTCAPPTVIGP